MSGPLPRNLTDATLGELTPTNSLEEPATGEQGRRPCRQNLQLVASAGGHDPTGIGASTGPTSATAPARWA
jgi:hypothetical protein